MMHFNCSLGRPGCDGFDVDVDEANITPETFGILTDARDAHTDAHIEAERPEVRHIRKQINPRRVRGNGFYSVKLSSAEDGSQTLCGADPTTEDQGWGDTRHAKGLSFVNCQTCIDIRTAAIKKG